jgi:hypothetical protein
MIFFLKLMLCHVQSGDPGEAVGATEKGVDQEKSHDNDQHAEHFPPKPDVGIGQPLDQILPQRLQKRFFPAPAHGQLDIIYPAIFPRVDDLIFYIHGRKGNFCFAGQSKPN